MSMRDIRKGSDYWDFYLKDVSEFIEEILEDSLKEDRSYKNRLGDGFDVHRNEFFLVSALYSSGASIEDCATQARKLLLEAYPRFISVCLEHPARSREDYAGGWDFRTRYLALAVLARLSPEEAKPLVDAVDFWPERDALWEVFIARLGHGTGRRAVNTLVWADAYADALAACAPEASDFERQVALMQFDKGWLAEMRRSTNPFYSNRDNKNNTYVGYWNFEAAAIAAMFGIDDTALTASQTYPKDWADWARR